MHKVILIMLLTVVSSSAMAEWKEVLKNKEAGFTVYADEKMFRDGNKTKIWVISDWDQVRKVNGRSAMSVKSLMECDCTTIKNMRVRFIRMTAYSKRGGRGEIVRELDGRDSKWLSVEPPEDFYVTTELAVWLEACADTLKDKEDE